MFLITQWWKKNEIIQTVFPEKQFYNKLHVVFECLNLASSVHFFLELQTGTERLTLLGLVNILRSIKINCCVPCCNSMQRNINLRIWSLICNLWESLNASSVSVYCAWCSSIVCVNSGCTENWHGWRAQTKVVGARSSRCTHACSGDQTHPTWTQPRHPAASHR